ncbi:30S ribosomal protein S6 [Caloramator sp. mosi_1]|uniref:Small ribosomal subunit protein bS6 n=1 Tax=Caloramator proteoclasticus DSM 10124 TaxID=1121262 RepID=A0A1M4U1Q5_9CLOT|nr:MULTISPECIES: 30S ribosomal protein S6 [Caloramator]WDC85363.1 30S ribosomal protein S6 [Caloramator sp. mosi_1]SHE50590.1 SSU ribosomal protein S6P [Caloramator proteoclasticus DSM 10124]
MRKYEALYVLAPNLTEEEIKANVEKFKNVVVNGGGEVENIDEWGKRKLAYEINHVNEGYYVLMNFSANSELPMELDRVLRISDSVIRHLVVNLQK